MEIEVAGRDYMLHQSPSLLNAHREGGTTGAVIWKITPLVAAWLSSMPPLLGGYLHSNAVVVELGCGVTGLMGLVLSRLVKCYILTDQVYIMKYLKDNISANSTVSRAHKPGPKRKKNTENKETGEADVLRTITLDWEKDSVENLRAVVPAGSAVDLLLVCDCVYNEYLVQPLIQTCIDVCRLGGSKATTVVVVAQQLRTDTVFALFLESLMKEFDVWRVPDEKISVELRLGSGYAVHLATLIDAGQDETV